MNLIVKVMYIGNMWKKHKNCAHELADELLFEEFNNAVEKILWHKNPGFNRVSPNILKSLDEKYRIFIFKIIKDLFDKPDLTCEEWKRSKLVLLPKKEIFLILTIGWA